MTEIYDPLADFYNEDKPAREAGIKDPVTGLRSTVDSAEKQKQKNDEIARKATVSKRIVSHLISDDLGREWLYDLLTTSNVWGTPFTSDPMITAYNSGALYIGRMIEGWIKQADIKQYALMIEEGLHRERIWNEEVGTV